ncbi:MAG: LD-carboxypeptidase [Planctomycetes bacterium]|nr:LD-carboxypeptidase [Planctomycetota bacterium]
MTIGLVAPASHLFDPDGYRRAEARARSLGFKPKLFPAATSVHGYLAGEDMARAADLNAAFADDKVDAVWCLRGGYGCLRTLPHVDFDLIKRNPKVFIGYSDITALHLAIQKLVGLVTFHGPMLGSDVSEPSWDAVRRVVMTAKPAGPIGPVSSESPSAGQVAADERVVTLTGGVARGRLTGGNLSLVTRLLGTPFEPDLKGRILFLEDVGEAGYRIDGMLSQLRLSGKLGACAGIVFGRFTDAGGGGQPVKLPLETILRELTMDLGIPVSWGFRCGHVDDQTTVPYGVNAELNADSGTVRLVDSAVR